MTSFIRVLAAAAIAAAGVAAIGSGLATEKPGAAQPAPKDKAAPKPTVPFKAPRDVSIKDEPNADDILYGKRLLSETKRLMPEHVGAAMNCTSCHLSQGKVPFGAPFVTSYRNYPSYNPRAGREVTLEQRINGCFLRSMNGKAVDESSREMKAMVAYMQWLARDVPEGAKMIGDGIGTIDRKLVPNPARGKEIYAAQCVSCHGANGEGIKDRHGEFIFPPLWGDESFNIGAGMARTYTAAAFIKQNMPVGQGAHPPIGTDRVLSDQDAVDVAEYFAHQPRPDFPGKVNDWPKGGKPKDARY